MSFRARARTLLQAIRQARVELESSNTRALQQSVTAIEKGVRSAQDAFNKQVAPLLRDIGAAPNVNKTLFGGFKLKTMPKISDMDAKLDDLMRRAKNARNAASAKKSVNNAKQAAKRAANNVSSRQAIRNRLNALERNVGTNNGSPAAVPSRRKLLVNQYNRLNDAVKIGLRNNANVQNLVGPGPNSNFNTSRLNRINNVIKNATK